MKNFVVSTALGFFVLMSGNAFAANPITYTGTQALDHADVAYSFTTDGTLGAIGPDNITGYNINITEGSDFAALTPANSTLEFYSVNGAYTHGAGDTDLDHLTATASSLSFLFDGSVTGVFIYTSLYEGPFFCLQNNACTNGTGPQIQASATTSIFYGSPYLDETGDVVIATSAVSAAPEAGIWAMLLAGVGILGGVLRTGYGRRHEDEAFGAT